MHDLFARRFDIFSDSVAFGGKDRSGDFLLVRAFKSERIVLMAVADGVGSHRCDWLASRSACESVAEEFEQTVGPVDERLRECVVHAHRNVRGATGDAVGMLSTLIAVAWPEDDDRIFFVGIGDSRIYLLKARQDLLLTEDDVVQAVLRLNDEVVFSAGAPVFTSGLTKALGQKGNLEFEVRTCDFLKGESLALATDGMHGKGSFVSGIREALHRSDLEAAVPPLVRHYASLNEDDAALVLLRRNDIAGPIAAYEEAITRMQDFREEGLWGHIMSRVLEVTLREAVTAGDFDRAQSCLAYMQRYSIFLRRDVLASIFEVTLREGKLDRNIIQMFRTVISRLN
jgi:serine/threonine protein phosphatase PrpC